MNIQDYAFQYAQAWWISTQNSAKTAIPALAIGSLAYGALKYYYVPQLQDSPGTPTYTIAKNERTKAMHTIANIGWVCSFITLGCVIKRWPLKPLSVFQMNSMGASALILLAIAKFAPRPPQKFELTAQIVVRGSLCISAIGCGASALGRLKDLTSNYAQRLFNR